MTAWSEKKISDSAGRYNNLIFIPIVVLLFIFEFEPYNFFGMLNGKQEYEGSSYLSHGLTIGLDYNLEYNNDICKEKNNLGKANRPIGPGLLASPFIAIFSFIDKIQHHAVIVNHDNYQYSWSIFGFVFATYFYFICSLFLYLQGLKHLGLKIEPWLFLLFSSSYGILHYVS